MNTPTIQANIPRPRVDAHNYPLPPNFTLKPRMHTPIMNAPTHPRTQADILDLVSMLPTSPCLPIAPSHHACTHP
jgi:hypothetical protein